MPVGPVKPLERIPNAIEVICVPICESSNTARAPPVNNNVDSVALATPLIYHVHPDEDKAIVKQLPVVNVPRETNVVPYT